MKRLCGAVVLSLVLFSLVSGQSAERKSPSYSKEQREVLAVLNDWVEALRQNDLAKLNYIVGDDYVITTSEGTMLNKEQDLLPVKTGDVKFQTVETEDVNVRVYGKTAIVTGIGSFHVIYKNRPLDVRERFTDVYVKRNGRWQPVASHATSLLKRQ
ncbi:MAG: nuclear transport factor 2 family protein [Acidobacteria bacterium]|nr:nuclear transport factor 2 family protein [Acidobacteriota bacterium]